MELKKQELLKALEIVKPGLAGKEIIEQTTSFAFINECVVTYNDEISISHPVEGLDMAGAIKADELYRLLGKIKQDSVDAKISDNQIEIKSGKGMAKFLLQSEIKLPLEEISERSDWRDIYDGFSKDLLFAAQTCSKDMSMPKITCVHLNPEGFVEATDRYRITRIEAVLPVDKGVLIPADAAVEVAKVNPTSMAVGSGWAHFQNKEGTVISCWILEEDYVDLADHVNISGKKITFPKTTLEIIEKAAVFAKRDHFLDESIHVTLEDKKMKVRAESENGSYEEVANIRYKDEPASFIITPYLFREILQQTLDCELTKDRIVFSGDNWKYVAMLRNE